jgi:hypothetical protein
MGKLKNNTLDLDLSKLKLFSTSNFSFLIPEHFDEDMKLRIDASIKSKILGVKSIDNIFKYLLNKNEKLENENEIILTDKVISLIKKRLNKIYKKHETIQINDQEIKIIAIHTALLRLRTSYEVCLFLIKLGYYFEANTIIRQIFEQFAFCINISDITNKAYDEIWETKSKKKKEFESTNISKFKNLITDLKIGVIYSDLSKKAHIDIEEAFKYLDFDNENGHAIIIKRSRNLTKTSAYLLYIMCYLHETVLEYSFKEYIKNYKFLTIENNIFKSKPNKIYVKSLKEIQEALIAEEKTSP